MDHNPYEKLTVVVADDSRAMREMLTTILQEEGVPKVLQAEDGEGVMRLLTAADAPAVDLIFCDLAMPGIDGVETMRRIAASPLQPAIALISGHDPKILQSVSNMTTELGLHVVGMLSKPFAPEAVVALLKESLMARRIYRARQTFATSVADLDEALAHDRVELYYQPKVRLSDAKLIGVEALVRIQHPALGLLEPDQFIAVAEARGRIVPLTTIVLEKAIAQAGAWYRNGLDLSVAINLSTLALARLDLPEIIGGLAEAAGVPTDRITIEVTESQVGESAEILHILSRLRLRGFHLSIDDYGTGQSGLQRLKRLPFNELKIDKSFVTGAHRDPDLRSILEVSIDLGQRLRMDVVAEGVESWQDWQLLKQLGCDMAQGYAIAKPMPAAGVELWATTWQAPI